VRMARLLFLRGSERSEFDVAVFFAMNHLLPCKNVSSIA
jgi:hypothetical protein